MTPAIRYWDSLNIFSLVSLCNINISTIWLQLYIFQLGGCVQVWNDVCITVTTMIAVIRHQTLFGRCTFGSGNESALFLFPLSLYLPPLSLTLPPLSLSPFTLSLPPLSPSLPSLSPSPSTLSHSPSFRHPHTCPRNSLLAEKVRHNGSGSFSKMYLTLL